MAQLVARYLGVVEAAGSSPVTQRKKSESLMLLGFFCIVGSFKKSLHEIFSACSALSNKFFAAVYSCSVTPVCTMHRGAQDARKRKKCRNGRQLDRLEKRKPPDSRIVVQQLSISILTIILMLIFGLHKETPGKVQTLSGVHLFCIQIPILSL